MEWHLSPDRGFLPLHDPLARLTDSNLMHPITRSVTGACATSVARTA